MKRFFKYLFILPLLCLVNILFAQNQNLLKNFLTVEDGLSHNEVTSIVQDHDGFIWIGTRGGLNRYDGYEFKIFNQIPGDSNSLVNPSIESLFVDSKGNIWIGTKSGGVSKYNSATGTFINIKSNYKQKSRLLPNNRILSFHQDKAGKIWMGTWYSGVVIYDETTNSSKTYLENALINAIRETADGTIWLGTSHGLYEYNSSQDSFILRSGNEDGFSCTDIVYDEKRNVLWIISNTPDRLIKFDLRNHKKEIYRIDNSGNLNKAIHVYESNFVDINGNVWLGTWGTGFYMFDTAKEQFERVNINPPNLGTLNKDYDTVLEIFQDKDNNIWLGTNGGGIVLLTKKLAFNSVGYHPEPGEGLVNTRIMSVLNDRNGHLWLGTIGSGVVWSPDLNNFYQVEYPEIVPKSKFFVAKYMFEDAQGQIWIGSEKITFLIEFVNGIPKMIPASEKYPEFPYDRTAVSFEETEDLFFYGTLQRGLYVLDKNNAYKAVKHLTQGDSLSGNLNSNRISYLLKDSKDRIWVGTYNGLHIYNPEYSTVDLMESVFDVEGELTGNIITCLNEDQKGNIWIGTPNGLNKLSQINENYKVEYYTEKDGLTSNFVKGISHDLDGNIWLSTNAGISKFETDKGMFVNFDETDGVLGKNFTEASVYQNTKTGEIFFGGTHGLTWFNPNMIQVNQASHKPILTGLTVLNQSIEVGKKYSSKVILKQAISKSKTIELSHDQNKIEIQFSALDFEANGKNKYKYILENRDQQWTDIGHRRFAIINELKPGEYIFKVKSSNRHNIWNEEAATLKIIVKPPFWQTWYALIFYILLVVGIVSIIRWNAVKQVQLANSLEMEKIQHEQDQRINEMKLRFFTNLSHEFRTPLTLILAPLKELLGKKEQFELNEKAQNKISIVQNNSLRLMKLVNQLLDFRKVESGKAKLQASKIDISDLLAEICYPFHELAKINNISFKTNLELKPKNLWIDREKLEVIVNNLISNAFKYAGNNGKIEVGLYEEEDEVLLTVSDNGPGIPKTELNNIFHRFYQIGSNDDNGSSGIGLALVKRYVELHHGSITVISKPNEHTEFTVSLPKGTDHFKPEEMVRMDKFEKELSRTQQFIGNVLPARSPKQNEKSAGCILVVEDNEEVNNYLTDVLQNYYCVYTAENGAEGFEIALEKLPDIIISDVMMPKVDGFEFCKKIRTNESTSTIPFIFLTAKSDEQFHLLGTKLGADDFISKPFDPNLLLEKIKNILESRKKLQKQYSKSIRLEPSDVEITSSEEVFVEKVITVIEDNLQNHKFTSDVLASEMNMSNSSLYRKLKRLTGSSTAEFVRSIRIKRAAQLLADKERTITEIAYEIGFNDVKHFRTVFQKQFKCSPSEYREKL